MRIALGLSVLALGGVAFGQETYPLSGPVGTPMIVERPRNPETASKLKATVPAQGIRSTAKKTRPKTRLRPKKKAPRAGLKKKGRRARQRVRVTPSAPKPFNHNP